MLILHLVAIYSKEPLGEEKNKKESTKPVTFETSRPTSILLWEMKKNSPNIALLAQIAANTDSIRPAKLWM